MELAVSDCIESDDYIKKFEETLEGIFLMYFYSPKMAREIKAIADLENEVIRHFGGMKKIRWVASRLRALEALAFNYKHLVNHLEHLAIQSSTGSGSVNFSKAAGYLKTVKNIKFLEYLYFSLDFGKVLKSLSLIFQSETTLVCSISFLIEKSVIVLKNLKTFPGENYRRFTKELTTNENGQMFKGVNLTEPSYARKTRQTIIEESTGASTENNQLDQGDPYINLFSAIIDDAVNFIEKGFQSLEKPPLVWFKIFNTYIWPTNKANLQSYGNIEIENLLKYYHTQNYITDEEKSKALQEWPLLKMDIFQRRSVIEDIPSPTEIFETIIKTPTLKLEMGNILILVEIMMVISVSTASCERGFSHMNNEKTS